ncbi:filamentous hemagglutinin N-terminal domain-containing protein, partial [Campylobacter sp. 9BO]|uniref:two-partner secretion domain-containing protein n=1 Tax=Campylobacter sp. 9BO TaxID=3424759 RepID=UPI003D351C22
TSLANIIPDLSAAKSNQPVILKANNEALIVNIVTPNNKGISFNEYSKFNTPDTGTVLNNSVNGDTTSIAGFVGANPFLNGGSAKLIVNQVNSNDPSLLKGNLEIAGKRADLIIANPSGININGLNIINANSSTFSTAKLNLNTNGDLAPINLSSPNLSQSVINIQGNGLNDKNSNYTNIIANTIKIASAIHANELNLISSDSKIKSKDNKIFNDVAINNQDRLLTNVANNNQDTANTTNPTPAILIDSTALGGMYANKINIIATKDGVGVNNAGIIKANQIKINSNGDIINQNIIQAQTNLDAHSNNAITNKDKANILSGSDIKLSAKQINNMANSNIVAANSLNLKASEINNASSLILADNIDAKADKLNNYSLNKLEKQQQTFSSTLDLKCCGEKLFKLSADIKKIKDEIINQWQLENKAYSDDELNLELYNRVVSQDSVAYALNLQKDSHLHGTSSHPFTSIKLDEALNSIIVTTTHVKDNEKTRTLYYSITKEFITPDSLANFIPSKIYASSDINFNIATITNDKSQIYAGNDIRLNASLLNNIGYDLSRSVSSHTSYYWEEKVKWYKNGSLKTKWETKGGDGEHINRHYADDGYMAIFAANNNFYASLTNLNNGDINSKANKTIDIPKFQPNHILPTTYLPVNTGFLYTNDGSSPAFTLGKFDTLYKDMNALLSSSFDKSKGYKQSSSSLFIAKNEISIDADGNIFNSAAMIANNISLNANSITNKDATLIADSAISLNANKDLNLSSTSASANQIVLNANDININQTSQTTHGKNYTSTTLGSRSNLNSTQSLEIKANNDISINGAILNSDQDINLKANNNLVIKTSQSRDNFNISGKDTTFKGAITKNTSSNLKAANINARANNISLVGANLNANESINLKADKNIEISSINNQIDLTSTVTQKGFLSKKQTTTKTIKEDVVSSNLNANNINIISNKDTTIQGANLVAD